jgi:uncharacterized protein YjbI with pentapeptide repeats
MTTNAPDPSADAKALLDAANSASEKVATLHIAFLALCTYVLVIVFSTTDLDLLLGKGIKLPVVDVEVPIVGFYATVPYLLVLVHFNLLLVLQLHSRKLYALDQAISRQVVDMSNQGSNDGLYDRLNVFPFNYYLIGRPDPLVAFFIESLVVITILLLPVLSLLTLQARFLAYQSVPVTWAQRIATWLDVGFVVLLWPVIVDRQDSWCDFWNCVWQFVKRHWLRWAWGFAGFIIVVLSLVSGASPYRYKIGRYVIPLAFDGWLFIAFAAWLLLTILAPIGQRVLCWFTGVHYFKSSHVKPMVFGLTGLLTTVLLGLPLPLILRVVDEAIDRPDSLAASVLVGVRSLALNEKVLLGKATLPTTIADLRSIDHAKRQAAERSIDRIDLQHRNLHSAFLAKALAPLADLRFAELQQAELSGAQLRGADLYFAHLEGANLSNAHLEGATLYFAHLEGADLSYAHLEGTNLSNAHLEGADLSAAHLEGADLSYAQLQGADLSYAQLQGADLSYAQLQVADLGYAQLQGADLFSAHLYANKIAGAARVQVVDVRGLKWKQLIKEEVQQLQEKMLWASKDNRRRFSSRIFDATSPSAPPRIGLCLRDQLTELICENDYDREEFRARLFRVLEKFVCQSPYIAHGVLRRAALSANDPQRGFLIKGLESRLQEKLMKDLSNGSCPGLFSLLEADKAFLAGLAKMEADEDIRR